MYSNSGARLEQLSISSMYCHTIPLISHLMIDFRKLITKVRNVLEAQSPRPNKRTAAPSGSAPPETINIHTDIQQFESFLRSISRCSSLLDARRLKNDVMGEIRRTRVLLANHENEDWIEGKKTEEVVAFLDRLYSAKRKVEKRIIVLGGEDDISVGVLLAMFSPPILTIYSHIPLQCTNNRLINQLSPCAISCRTLLRFLTLWSSWTDEVARCLFNSGSQSRVSRILWSLLTWDCQRTTTTTRYKILRPL